jgi:hypothetical protein
MNTYQLDTLSRRTATKGIAAAIASAIGLRFRNASATEDDGCPAGWVNINTDGSINCQPEDEVNLPEPYQGGDEADGLTTVFTWKELRSWCVSDCDKGVWEQVCNAFNEAGECLDPDPSAAHFVTRTLPCPAFKVPGGSGVQLTVWDSRRTTVFEPSDSDVTIGKVCEVTGRREIAVTPWEDPDPDGYENDKACDDDGCDYDRKHDDDEDEESDEPASCPADKDELLALFEDYPDTYGNGAYWTDVLSDGGFQYSGPIPSGVELEMGKVNDPTGLHDAPYAPTTSPFTWYPCA